MYACRTRDRDDLGSTCVSFAHLSHSRSPASIRNVRNVRSPCMSSLPLMSSMRGKRGSLTLQCGRRVHVLLCAPPRPSVCQSVCLDASATLRFARRVSRAPAAPLASRMSAAVAVSLC